VFKDRVWEFWRQQGCWVHRDSFAGWWWMGWNAKGEEWWKYLEGVWRKSMCNPPAGVPAWEDSLPMIKGKDKGKGGKGKGMGGKGKGMGSKGKGMGFEDPEDWDSGSTVARTLETLWLQVASRSASSGFQALEAPEAPAPEVPEAAEGPGSESKSEAPEAQSAEGPGSESEAPEAPEVGRVQRGARAWLDGGGVRGAREWLGPDLSTQPQPQPQPQPQAQQPPDPSTLPMPTPLLRCA